MTSRQGVLVILVVAASGLLAARALRAQRPSKLPALEPRGQVVRGVEVFAFGRYHQAELAELAHAVHGGVAGLLGRPCPVEGARIHTFPDAAACARYTARATGVARATAAYLFAGDDRVIVLHPDVPESAVQHELTHHAIDRALGSVPRWFTEGLASHVEDWTWTSGGLAPRIGSSWADRLLERARPQREVEKGIGFLGDDEQPSYARSWATVLALLLLRHGRGPLDPDHGLAPEALDDLGFVLAEHWSHPRRRVDDLIAAAGASDGPRRDTLLGLAELAASRFLSDGDPLSADARLARAVRDGSSDGDRRFRAAVAAVAAAPSSATATDWVRLAETAAARSASQTARRALEWSRRAPGTPRSEVVSLTRGTSLATLTLRSSTWDEPELERLARRAVAAIGEIRRLIPEAPVAASVRVELPAVEQPTLEGASGEIALAGWPEDPWLGEELARALVAALVDPHAEPALVTWERAGLLELLRGELDPVHAARVRGAARAALHGPLGVASRVSDDACPLGDPLARSLAAFRMKATGRRDAPAPWSAAFALVDAAPWRDGGDPGASLSADPGGGGPLLGDTLSAEHRRFFLLAALHGGGGAGVARALAEELRAAGHPLAARLLDGWRD